MFKLTLVFLAGRIENWRLGPGGDDLRNAPFFIDEEDSPNFNKLFAALYDLIFGKMTNMGLVITSRDCTLTQISRGVEPVSVVVNRRFRNIDNYVNRLDDDDAPAAADSAAADAAAAATAAALAAAVGATGASGGSGGPA